MEYNYIYKNQFVSSDEELNPNEYEIGSTLDDYSKGKYVPLNADQLQYLEEHPDAPPEEVFMMQGVPFNVHVPDKEEEMYSYFEANHKYFLLNGEKCTLFDHKDVRYIAELYKETNREYMEVLLNGKIYRATTDYILQMVKDLAIYYFEVNINITKHYKYIEQHPNEKSSYDYTTGFPTILSFTLQEIG